MDVEHCTNSSMSHADCTFGSGRTKGNMKYPCLVGILKSTMLFALNLHVNYVIRIKHGEGLQHVL